MNKYIFQVSKNIYNSYNRIKARVRYKKTFHKPLQNDVSIQTNDIYNGIIQINMTSMQIKSYIKILQTSSPYKCKTIRNNKTQWNGSIISQSPRFYFSNNSDSRQVLIHPEAFLTVRNSQTYELKLTQMDPKTYATHPLLIPIDNQLKLKDLKKLLTEELNLQNVSFSCEDNNNIALKTPLSALINRHFLIASEINVFVEGQLLSGQVESVRQKRRNFITQQLKHLQLPLLTQRQFQGYLQRISIMVEAKKGMQLEDNKIKMKPTQAQDILVQALLDPKLRHHDALSLNQQWQSKYMQVMQMKNKYDQALIQCTKIVRRKMFIGLGFITANIGFVWSGTYVFFSWDIIEPLAYFTSSFAAILFTLQFLNIHKHYSNQHYRDYLMSRHMQAACTKVGISQPEYRQKISELHQIQSSLKDALIRKL